MQRPPAARVGRVEIGAVADQQTGRHLLVRRERRVKRRIRVRVFRPRRHIGAMRQQQLDDLCVAEECSQVQRRPPVRAVSVDARRQLDDQPLDTLDLAGRGGLEQRQRGAARNEQIHNLLLPVVNSS